MKMNKLHEIINNIESEMVHHGGYGYRGRFGDGLISKDEK